VIEPTALPVQRSPKQTLYHAWAPKLGRTIVFAGRDQLHLWVMLEAHPEVTRYCERPIWPADSEPPCPAADFWALRDGKPMWLAVQETPLAGLTVALAARPGLVVESILPDEFERHRVWIQNWLSLLPYLSAASALALGELQVSIIEFVGREARIGDVERHFASVDAVLVRTAVIAALHQGRLISEELQSKPWDGNTQISKVSKRRRNASQ
jgi:hypothetical protein